jgi:hypothetical protein
MTELTFACDCSAGDAGDYTQFQETRTVKARKPHECCECGERINPGEYYTRDFIVAEDQPNVFITCIPCTRIREDYCPFGYMFGCLAEQIRGCMGWDYRDKPEDIELDEDS